MFGCTFGVLNRDVSYPLDHCDGSELVSLLSLSSSMQSVYRSLARLNAYHLSGQSEAHCITAKRAREGGIERARGGRAQKQAWMARYRSGSASLPSCCRCRQSFNLGNRDEDGLPFCPLVREQVLGLLLVQVQTVIPHPLMKKMI